jgi:hypothetical protein
MGGKGAESHLKDPAQKMGTGAAQEGERFREETVSRGAGPISFRRRLPMSTTRHDEARRLACRCPLNVNDDSRAE